MTRGKRPHSAAPWLKSESLSDEQEPCVDAKWWEVEWFHDEKWIPVDHRFQYRESAERERVSMFWRGFTARVVAVAVERLKTSAPERSTATATPDSTTAPVVESSPKLPSEADSPDPRPMVTRRTNL